MVNAQVLPTESRNRSPLRTIMRGSAWFGLAIGANRLLPGVLILILAWWLNPSQLGVISFVLAYYALLLPVADWSISYALQKLIPDQQLLAKQVYWTALLVRLGISMSLGLFCWLLDVTTKTFHGYGSYLALLLVFSTFGTVVYAHNAVKNFSRGSLYSIALHVVWVCLALSMVKAGLPIRGPLLGLILSFLVLGLWSSFLDPSIRGRFTFLPDVASKIIRFGLWATLAIVLSSVAGQIGVLVVDYLNGDAAAGIFKVATTFGVASALFGMVVVLPLMPVAREGLLNGSDVGAELVRPIVRYLLMLGLPITVVGFVLAPEVVATFTRHSYASAVWPLRVLLGANLLRMLMTAASGILFVGEGLRALAKIYGIMAGVTLVAGVALTRRWGINGMAAGQLIAWIGGAVLMYRWFSHNTPVSLEWKSYSRYALSAIVTGAVAYLCARLVSIAFERLALGICVSGATYLLLLWFQRDLTIVRAMRALRNWAVE